MSHHVHMLVSLPPKYSVSQVVGFIKARVPFIWRGCTGNEAVIREYIKNQEKEDERLASSYPGACKWLEGKDLDTQSGWKTWPEREASPNARSSQNPAQPA